MEKERKFLLGGPDESRREPVIRGLRPPKDNKSDSKENADKE